MAYEWKMSYDDVDEVIASVNEQLKIVNDLSSFNLKIGEYPKGTDNIPGVSAIFSEYNNKYSDSIDKIINKLKKLSNFGSDIIEQTKKIESEVSNDALSAHKITNNSNGKNGKYSFEFSDKDTYNSFIGKLNNKYNFSNNSYSSDSSQNVSTNSDAVSLSSLSSTVGPSGVAIASSVSSFNSSNAQISNDSKVASSSKKENSENKKNLGSNKNKKKNKNKSTSGDKQSSNSTIKSKKSSITASQAIVISLFEKEILTGKSTIQDLVNYMRKVNIRESVIVDYLVNFINKHKQEISASGTNSTEVVTPSNDTNIISNDNVVNPSEIVESKPSNDIVQDVDVNDTLDDNQEKFDVSFENTNDSHYFTNEGNVSSNINLTQEQVSSTPVSTATGSSNNSQKNVVPSTDTSSSSPVSEPSSDSVLSNDENDSQSITETIEDDTTDLFGEDDDYDDDDGDVIDSKNKGSIPVAPIVGGVAAAAAATVGAKIYMDRHDNNDFDLDDDRPSNDNKFWTSDDAQVVNSEEDNYSDDDQDDFEMENTDFSEREDSEYHATQNNLDGATDEDSWSMPDDTSSQDTFDLLGNND